MLKNKVFYLLFAFIACTLIFQSYMFANDANPVESLPTPPQSPDPAQSINPILLQPIDKHAIDPNTTYLIERENSDTQSQKILTHVSYYDLQHGDKILNPITLEHIGTIHIDEQRKTFIKTNTDIIPSQNDGSTILNAASIEHTIQSVLYQKTLEDLQQNPTTIIHIENSIQELQKYLFELQNQNTENTTSQQQDLQRNIITLQDALIEYYKQKTIQDALIEYYKQKTIETFKDAEQYANAIIGNGPNGEMTQEDKAIYDKTLQHTKKRLQKDPNDIENIKLTFLTKCIGLQIEDQTTDEHREAILATKEPWSQEMLRNRETLGRKTEPIRAKAILQAIQDFELQHKKSIK